jgi:hypothetical protein
MSEGNGKNKNTGRKPVIRPVSRITSGPLGKLRSTHCFPEIDRRIRLGWSVSDVADMIQEEYKECTDTSKKYLRKLLDDYRKSIPPAELSMTSSNSLISRNATKVVAQGIDELIELEKLYNVQYRRIMMEVGNEEKINKLFPNTGREVFVAMKLLRQSAELKMDLGLVKRQLGHVEVTGQLAADVSDRYGKDSIGKVISDPESRRKVLGIAERLIQLGAKASLDAVEMLGQAAQERRALERGNIIDVEAVEVAKDAEEPSQEDSPGAPQESI